MIGIATVSSRGQIVLPKEVRKGIKKGEQFLIMRKGDQLLMKKANVDDKAFEADWEFAQKTDQAIERMKKGDAVVYDSVDDFLAEKW